MMLQMWCFRTFRNTLRLAPTVTICFVFEAFQNVQESSLHTTIRISSTAAVMASIPLLAPACNSPQGHAVQTVLFIK